MKTTHRKLKSYCFTYTLATGIAVASIVTLLLSLASFQARASIIEAAVVVEQASTPIDFDTSRNWNADFGDTVNANADYTIQSCPLCSDGGISGTSQASVVTSLGSISASGTYRFDGNRTNGSVTSGFTQRGRFFIDDITISYRGIDPQFQNLNRVNANLHLSLDTDFIGNSTGFNVFATMNGQPRQQTIGAGFLNDALINFTSFGLPINQLFSLDVTASILIRSIYQETKNAHIARANWSLVLGGSPAFILPEGFFANSADGSIVDNYFVGNSGPSNVPEPALGALLLTGFGMLLRLKKAHRTH